MKTLDFFQIWFEDSQQKHLYDFATPYYNEQLTPYFENSIIADLALESNADLIGIASWRLKQKRQSLPAHRVLKCTAGTDFSREKIISANFDVAILTPMMPKHRMLLTGLHSYRERWTSAFGILSGFLNDVLSMDIPQEVSYPVYGNHFIATREIYREYVSECLIPTLDFMETEKLIFHQDSGYSSKKANTLGLQSVKAYQEKSGCIDWPIAPFLLERLFSLWIEHQHLKVVNL